MDPYLEAADIWPDCHLTLVIAMRAQLNSRLPAGYVAAADRYVWIHEPEADERTRQLSPDVFVVETQGEGSVPVASANVAATATPATAAVVLPATQREGNKYIKILDAKSRRLITVIELLSPANKRPGPDREAYLSKRVDYLAAGVNVVEIDLLRGGQRLPVGQLLPDQVDYYALVARATAWPHADLWLFSVRDPLPTIPIPLQTAEPDVSLNLRDCLDRAYSEGRYAEELNYRLPAEPPLRPTDAAWAAQLVAAL